MCVRSLLGLVTSGVVAGLFLAGTGCLPQPHAERTEPDHVWPVSVRDLHNSYRDGSARWTTKRVRVVLEPGQYRCADDAVYWDADRKVDPPSVAFIGARAPDDKARLTVEGTVAGLVAFRGGATVMVTGCSVSARP